MSDFKVYPAVTSQPGMYPAAVLEQPGRTYLPQERGWSTGTCACFNDMSSCCCTFFCHFWYLSCVVAPKMGEHCCTPYCFLLGQNSPIVTLRTKLRTAHRIQGSLIDDCLMGTFCGPCSTCQIVRELSYIEKTTGQPAFTPK